jgi:L-ascorbate metabolism protein UlaG (beta-lactamase superfamily)
MNDGFSRGEFLQASAAVGAAGTVRTTVGATGRTATLKMRWYGGGVYELATPDDKTIVLVDAWIWNNTGFKAFGIDKPAELSSASAYAAHIKGRSPDAVIVALTHDHGDHIGDYFELLGALSGAGVDVKTVGQSDLMRVALVPKFKAANLDNTQLVLNGGAGINMGGTASYKGVKIELVPAVHSTIAGYPAAGFIIDIGGARVYASGDTDVYGDMALVGQRYKPDIAIVCTGNGAFTMGPEDAALTCKLTGVAQAVPVHYAHNPLVIGPQCGDLFAAAVARVSPGTKVTLLKPGSSTTLQIATNR